MPNRKLLLADDSVTIQKVVNLTFADEGIEVISFGDGDSALAAIRDVRPDIVLADVNMPGASGYRICEAIRAAPDTQRIPVILLVGSFEPFDDSEAGRVAADGYLTKPFQSIRQLVARVHELIGPPAEAEPAQEFETMQETVPQFEIPAAKPPERTDDIESLYHQSVTGAPPPPSFEIGDQGLDDEMIETSYAAPAQEERPFGYESPAADLQAAEEPSHADTTSQGWSTEPAVDASTWEQEQPIVANEMPDWQTGQGGTDDRSSARDPEQPPPVEKASEWEPEQPPPVWHEEIVPTSDQYAFEERPEEPRTDASQLENARTQIFNFQEPATAEPESYIGQETVAFNREEIELPEQEATRSYTDMELLDLPPAGSNQTLELTTPERAELMGSDRRAVSISPELMELIVQKVVERLSQKY